MNIAWIALGIVLIVVALVGLITFGVAVSDYDGKEMALIATVGVVVILVCTPGAVISFIAAGRNLNETSCASFADQTGYETKVIVTNMFDTGGCFVRLDGRWVPREQLWAEMRGDPS